MTDHGIAQPLFRRQVVQAVSALADPALPRQVRLDPAGFEDLDYTVCVLFDEFCDTDEPFPWLGQSLRTEEEVELMAALGVAYTAVQDALGPCAPDAAHLDAPGWPAVVAAAARLAPLLAANDLAA
ncbi:hypothetical protein AB0E96_03985 [Kitasatospora sp. NPDC036755]|uniref:SCO4402 family protein n=1 Tax=Kitasatospora sp. NPDC036755 TaxID=3154600 RepID=UPI0033DEACF9